MSTEALGTLDKRSFTWNDALEVDDYILVTYQISTCVDPEQAALGIAREQSACTLDLPGDLLPRDLEDFTARVVSVSHLGSDAPPLAAMYFLNTPVYGEIPRQDPTRQAELIVAYPQRLFGASLARCWNSVFGEVHRLGYLLSAKITNLRFPERYLATFPGPKFGVGGIRRLLGVPDRPIFCRSMRPAVGLTTRAMLDINREVLLGGFDVIKDDELTYHSARSPFPERVRRMAELKREIEDRTGERKLYFANVIDDYPRAIEMAETAAEVGADGVLVSVYLQGFSIIRDIADTTGLVVLSHNSCGDAISRPNQWGASYAPLLQLQRMAGADLAVTPGPFASSYQDPKEAAAVLNACFEPHAGLPHTMPIIQGGKKPDELARYIDAVGSADFMIIAATSVDHHPEGIRQGARAFRAAWETLSGSS